jgi:RNA polymerase sigma factor (sigma-70 family)
MSSSALTAGLRLLRYKLAAQERSDDSDEQLLHAFTSRRDDGAFAALVRRHGPMVLHVCRRVLGHEQDAEDAFQATFLVLARNAAALRNKTVLASFLHGVAYRTAMKAKQAAARRRKHEAQAPARPPVDPADELSWREIKALLDEEITRLSEKYRIVFVLFYLEDLSREETARRLGLKDATVAKRLAIARQRLGSRLKRRGVELTAVLAASAIATQPASALPAGLMAATIQAALTTTGEGLAGVVSASVADLAQGAIATVTLSKAKIVTALLLTTVLLAGGGAWTCWMMATPQVVQPQAPSLVPTLRVETRDGMPRQDKHADVTVNGRVVDPDGKPVRGAKLLFLWWFEQLPQKVWATTGADGRFVFTTARSPAANSGWEMPGSTLPYVVAAAEGYGFAVAPLDKPEAAADLTLRLVKDDMPIRGRVLNLEGKPIAGVRVRVNDLEPLNQPQLYVPNKGDLTDWLAALKAKKNDPWRLEEAYLTGLASPAFHLLFPPVTTGADGRFELRGIGRERMVHLRIEGPTIATQIVNVMTRPNEPIRYPLSRSHPKGEPITYHGATFEILAEPTKPVVGVVRDRETGKPLAGVTIKPNKISNPFGIGNHNAGLIQTTTDKDGRYRLVGLPKGDDNQLMATTDDLPYLPLSKKVENTPGLGPVTVDFALKRGIWVKGRVTEKTTGKPLVGGVGYFCFRDNPHHTDIPSVLLGYGRRTRKDGSYRFVVIPGRGLISVQVSHNNRYLSGVGAEKIEGPRRKMGANEGFDTYPFMCQTWNRNAVVEINPKPGDESITCDLVVVPARSVKGTVLGPDGKPLSGARQYRWDTLPGSEFTVWGLPPGKLSEPWQIEFVHESKKLAGFVTVHGDEKEPLQVRLQPWGVLTGRLVNPQGEPLSGVKVACIHRVDDVYADKDGRFRIEGLTPGLKYEVYVSKESLVLPILGGEPKDLTVQPGETKDLGVLKVKGMK